LLKDPKVGSSTFCIKRRDSIALSILHIQSKEMIFKIVFSTWILNAPACEAALHCSDKKTNKKEKVQHANPHNTANTLLVVRRPLAVIHEKI